MTEYKRLLKYVLPFWPTFMLAVIAMILAALFETATGALLVPIFGQFLPAGGQSATLFNLHNYIPAEPWYQAWLAISLLLLGFAVCKGVASYFSAYLMAKIGQSVILGLRQEVYDHLLTQPASFFERHRTNFLVSRLVVSCAAIEHAVSANLRDVIRESFMLVFFIGAAFYFNWRLMLGALVIGPVVALLTTRFSSSLRKLADTSIEGNKALADTAQETLANHAIVKAYRAEERERSRFARAAQTIANANLRSGRISALSPPTLELIGFISIVVLFYFGLREINSGQMDAAQFFAFLFFLFRSYDPMRKISRQHNEVAKAFAAAKDLWIVLDEDLSLPERPGAVELGPLTSAIRIEDVSFSYQNDPKLVLDGVSIEIRKGETVALVGQSGGGKSSLIKLIQRLYDPDAGRILWDDTDLRDAKLDSLHRQIALVTQETVLFNESIAYNISYGLPDASSEEIRKAAEIAFAAEFINNLPLGYETLTGERGVLLSGGQRQRIAIARAVLLNAPVLILDEATSALDTESERLVQLALENLMRSKTSIVIAHRLSTVRKADRIVVMENGRIVETGTHRELIAVGGKYKRLYDLQFSDEEPVSAGHGKTSGMA
jgi:ATP-binding cassette, subfamily B, bacterial MsbA